MTTLQLYDPYDSYGDGDGIGYLDGYGYGDGSGHGNVDAYGYSEGDGCGEGNNYGDGVYILTTHDALEALTYL